MKQCLNDLEGDCMIKVMIFDLDDTLYNERKFVEGAFKEVCDYLAQKYELDSYSLYEDAINILEKNGRGKIFDLLCLKYEINHDIKYLVDIYRQAKPRLKLYKDSQETIKRYKNRYKLAIITDGKASVQWNKIRMLNIEKDFEKIIVTDDFGREYWKPNKFAFEEIVRYFNVKANECVYIGDNPNKDFIGSKDIGMHTIRIVRKNGDHMKMIVKKHMDADYTILNLNEIDNIINEIN
nr:HAD-IA family hydrolase [Clostridium botulinum]